MNIFFNVKVRVYYKLVYYLYKIFNITIHQDVKNGKMLDNCFFFSLVIDLIPLL